MRLKAIESFVCPCGADGLRLVVSEQDSDGDVVSGSLECDDCGIPYPVVSGIPRFVPKSN